MTEAAHGAGHADRYAICAHGLTKRYPGTEAVRGVDLHVRPGETFAFLGPNGAGKTTTIAMLCALARPSSGQARVAGADIRTQPQQVRRGVGLLFQNSAVDPDLSLERNLHLHARLYGLSRARCRSRSATLLELTGLTERRRDRVRTLSGGLRRRLEIARALLHEPGVLFLDEPTVGLDPHARAQIWDHLARLRAEHRTTVFVTTHYLDEAEHCDRIAILDRGRVVAHGTPAALKAAIGDDRVRVRTGDDTAAATALRHDLALRPTAGPDGLTVAVAAGPQQVPRLCAALAARGIPVHAITLVEPTLDDVFFHHTGRRITRPGPLLGHGAPAPGPGHGDRR
ncbi:ATP-binding cassette domain-containing protein [Streptomyces sp. NRRL F-5755]|uniref:ATP-binding cassette domain-containing protein n=1 Tax=Streptomyces sp. NRRL F-5755 TaxID=1519475 RepID=UPI0007C66D3F|nr:ATP-binding cassette domain-containing protein [Streptomyces sp. NRRL F-5755]